MGAVPSPHHRPDRRRVLAVPAGLLLLGLVPAASSGLQAPQKAPVFGAGTELVQVDAVVLDSRGNPVEGLKEDDFVVREDGQIQTVQEFEAVATPESPPSKGPATTSFVATNVRPTGERPGRSFVIVFDDAQLSKITAGRAREAVVRFLSSGLRDEDEVTLVSTATNAWWTARLGEGREDLLAVLRRLEGKRVVDTSGSMMSDYEAMRIYVNRDSQLTSEVTRRFAENGVIVDPGNANSQQVANDLQIGHQPMVQAKAAEAYLNERVRNQATLHALQRVASALAAGKGRKTVLLVSDGFVYDPSLPEFQEVVRAMAGASGSVYFLDARGLTGSSEYASAEFGRALLEQDVSSTLSRVPLETMGAESVAADTGGYSFRNPNDLEGGMERVARESRSYYLLGYTSRNTKRDGKLRKIQVEVRRPGLKVRARSGYYAPSDVAPEPRKLDQLDPRIREAIDSPFLVEGIPLRMAVYVLGPSVGDKMSVLVVAEVDPDGIVPGAKEGPLEATLDSYLVVGARDGGLSVPVEKEVQIALPASARARFRESWLPLYRELDLPPGVYQARLLLRDEKTGRAGTVRHEFNVPAHESFRTSTPILTDSLQGDPAKGPTRPVPLAHRAFPSGVNLIYVFEVYGAQHEAGQPRVTSACEVRRADGSPLVKSASSLIQPGPQGQLDRQFPISLEGAPPGEYEIVLTLEDEASQQRLQVVDPFTVLPAPAGSSPGRP